MKITPRTLSLIVFLIASQLTMRAQADSRQDSWTDTPPVSDDPGLLESTQPSEAIVLEVTPIDPGKGGILEQWGKGDAATGDWLGARSSLHDTGLTFFGSYESNSAANVSGGLGNGDGVLLIGQVGWTPEFFKKPVTHDAGTEMLGLPGHYWVGSYVTFWDVPRFGTDQKGNGPYAFYLHADQMIYQEAPGSGQGLTLWGAVVSQPDHKVNIIPFQVNGGVVYKGLIPQRDEDVTIFGIVYGEFSNDYARAQSTAGLGNPSYETVLEAGYRIQVSKFAYIMPEVQYIINPGGNGRLSDALVPGLRIGVTF